MKKAYRTKKDDRRGGTTHKLLSAATAVFLLLGTTTSVFAQPAFEGNLSSVSITDAAGTNTPPNANFTYTQNGDTFTFNASSSSDSDGVITGYKWDFGDGTIYKGIEVIFQPLTTDIFSVTLTVIDDAEGISLVNDEISSTAEALSFYDEMSSISGPYLPKTGAAVNVNGELDLTTGADNQAKHAVIFNDSSDFISVAYQDINYSEGKLEFLFQPNFTGAPTNSFYFFTSTSGTVFRSSFSNSGTLTFYSGGGSVANSWNPVAGKWYKMVFKWSPLALSITIDDLELCANKGSYSNQGNTSLKFGNGFYNGAPIMGAIDDLKIYPSAN